jgi:hypothetical protein
MKLILLSWITVTQKADPDPTLRDPVQSVFALLHLIAVIPTIYFLTDLLPSVAK